MNAGQTDIWGARSDPWSPHQSHLWTGWECFPHLVARRQMDRILLCPKRVTLPSAASLRRQPAARKSVCSTLSSSPGSTIGRTTGKYLLYSLPVPGGPFRQILALPLQGERKPSLVVERGTAGKNFLQYGHWLAPTSRPSRAGRKFTPCPLAAGRASGRSPPMEDNNRGETRTAKELYYSGPDLQIFFGGSR